MERMLIWENPELVKFGVEKVRGGGITCLSNGGQQVVSLCRSGSNPQSGCDNGIAINNQQLP